VAAHPSRLDVPEVAQAALMQRGLLPLEDGEVGYD
jgi:hypothetical protein